MLDTEIVLAKVEPVYGTDAAPVVATDAQIIFGWDPKPQQYDDVRRPIERGYAGATPKIKARGRQSHSLKFELAGSGTLDTATAWGLVWLRAALFGAPVPSAGVEVVYPLGTVGDGSSLTVFGFKQNVRMRTQGFRGNASLDFTAGAVPFGMIDGMGLLNNIPDASTPGTPTLPTYPAPLEVNSVNTAFSLGGYAALLRSFKVDLGMKTAYRDLVGQRSIIFDKADDGDRRAAKVNFVIELPDPSVKEYFSAVPARTDLAFSLVHGTVAGNIIDVSSAHLQLDELTFSTEQNRIMATGSGELVPSAAGNELVLKTR